MTTVRVTGQGEIQAHVQFPTWFLQVFQSVLSIQNESPVPEPAIGRSEALWLPATLDALHGLPWDNDDWNDGAKRTDPVAVAKLLTTLAQVLDSQSPPPVIVPTWRGGVQAEWHETDIDLEIECAPDGTIEYYFASPPEEFEGPIGSNLEQLIRHAGYLSSIEHTNIV